MNSRLIVTTLLEKDGKFLLGRKPKDKGPYPNTWHLPGGGVNLDNETIEEAVTREVKEETGLDVERLERLRFAQDHEPNKHGEVTRYVFLFFRVIPTNTKAKAADDLESLQWFTKAELKQIELNRPTIAFFQEIGLL